MSWLPNPRMVKQAASHIGMSAGTAVVILSLQAKGLSITQVSTYAQQTSELIEHLGSLFTTLTTTLGAAGGAYAAYRSMIAVSNKSSIQATREIASNPDSLSAPEAQKQLAEAVKTIAVSPEIPVAQEAKAAMIDAAASLDEVVGQIKVSDPTLARQTDSAQVVLAQ